MAAGGNRTPCPRRRHGGAKKEAGRGRSVGVDHRCRAGSRAGRLGVAAVLGLGLCGGEGGPGRAGVGRRGRGSDGGVGSCGKGVGRRRGRSLLVGVEAARHRRSSGLCAGRWAGAGQTTSLCLLKDAGSVWRVSGPGHLGAVVSGGEGRRLRRWRRSRHVAVVYASRVSTCP